MNITLIAVGKIKKSPENEIVSTYLSRCPWNINIIEVEEKRPIKGAERMTREGELILNAIPKGATVVALDERGRHMRSTEFAKKIQSWQD